MAVIGFEGVRRAALWNGRSFGPAGPYERITGIVKLAVDPELPGNLPIVDLELAPRGDDGRVHFEADFCLVRPASTGNGALIFDIPNRGRRIGVPTLNHPVHRTSDRPLDEPDPPGNAFLMRHGYALAECGWQHDVLPQPGRLGLRAPEALQDGHPLSGPIMCQFEPVGFCDVLALAEELSSGTPSMRAYPPLDVDEPGAILTVRDDPEAPARPVPRDRWRFARLEAGRVVSDLAHIYLSDGFEAGKTYTLVYTASGAPVVGTGLLAIRDVASWLKYGDVATGNPAAGSVGHTYGVGRSQSAHVLRHLLYLGLNEDEEGRPVFDGALPIIGGARRGEFNLRFGQPAKTLGLYAGGLFPFSDTTQTDPETGETDGLLARLANRREPPKIVYLDSSAEYWSRNTSLLHTDLTGTMEVDLPPTTRLYVMAGTQHGGGLRGPQLSDQYMGLRRVRYPENSLDYSPLERACLVILHRWASTGEEPPPSTHPRLDNGTATTVERVLAFFGTIPGIRPPGRVLGLARMDFGPRTPEGVLTTLPPKLGADYALRVPTVDQDGNDVAGLRHPELSVPLATYTGWNLQPLDSAGSPDSMVLRAGSTFPFPPTAAERHAGGDPRRSIEERYGSKDDYLGRVRVAADRLVGERFLLEEDVDDIVEAAGLRWDVYTPAPATGTAQPGSSRW